MPLKTSLRLSAGKTFVKRSARLLDGFWEKTLIIPAANESLHLWKVIDTCFFFNVVSGFAEDFTTDSLSQQMLVGPSKGTPIILSLYLSAIIISVPVFEVTYSKPNVDVSMVFCLLEYHMMGAMLQKIKITV